MWKRMMQGVGKRKSTHQIPLLRKKRTKLQQRKKQQQKQPQPQLSENISTASSTLLNKSHGTAAGSSISSSVCLIPRRSSAVSSNAFPSTSHSTLGENLFISENNSSQSLPRSNVGPEPEVLWETRRSEAKLSETSYLESAILKESAAVTSEQISCSSKNILRASDKESYFGKNDVHPEQISAYEPADEWKKEEFEQTSVYHAGEWSCSDSVFDAEIETAMSNLDRETASPCIISDTTPSFPSYSDCEVYSSSPFLGATSDDFEDSAVHSSVSSYSSLIIAYQEKFRPWKDYMSANISYANLPQVSFSITDLSESRNDDDEKVFKLEDDEDERTFEKFKAREQKQALFWHNLWDYLDINLTDAIGKQRLLMINWIMEYTASHQLQMETLFLSANFLDRFLSKGTFTSEIHLQVLGIACMTLAIRLEENQPTNCIKLETFTVANTVFKRREIVAMEWLVLKVLNYRCSSPTVATFLWYYLKAAGGDVEVEKTAKYLACLSLVDRQLLRFWPSTIAASLVILACELLHENLSYQLLMEKCGKDGDGDLNECIERMEWLLENVW